MVEAELSDAHLPMVSLWNSDIFVCGEGREKKNGKEQQKKRNRGMERHNSGVNERNG